METAKPNVEGEPQGEPGFCRNLAFHQFSLSLEGRGEFFGGRGSCRAKVSSWMLVRRLLHSPATTLAHIYYCSLLIFSPIFRSTNSFA